MAAEIIHHRLGAEAKRKNHAMRAEAAQPVEQIDEIRFTGNRRQKLRRVAKHGPNSRALPTGKDEHVQALETMLA